MASSNLQADSASSLLLWGRTDGAGARGRSGMIWVWKLLILRSDVAS